MSDHLLHFYEGDEALHEKVSAFLADGARAGQPLVVFAAASHREAILAGLRSRGIDVDALRSASAFAKNCLALEGEALRMYSTALRRSALARPDHFTARATGPLRARPLPA